jgi:hypothetical protein
LANRYEFEISFTQELPRMGPAVNRVWAVYKAMWREATRCRRPFIWPANGEVARLAGVCKRTVMRAKAKLDKAGFLLVRPRFIAIRGRKWRLADQLIVVINDKARQLALAFKPVRRRPPMGDSSVTPRRNKDSSERYSPSPTTKRLVSEGLGGNRRW